MTEFRHTIGDALYGLETFEDPHGLMDERTVMHTIRKRTDRYVYISDGRAWDSKLIRFSIADLERDGRAWNQANLQSAYVRPLPHWPLMLVENRPANMLTAAER